jgi:hypothetical protein
LSASGPLEMDFPQFVEDTREWDTSQRYFDRKPPWACCAIDTVIINLVQHWLTFGC